MSNEVNNQYLNSRAAASYLCVSLATIYGWVSAKKIPFRKHGSRVVFNRADLDRWSAMRANQAG